MERGHVARRIVGWAAVAITVVIVNHWTYWGIIENFHEGWYSTSLLENLFMLFVQYLLFTMVFSGLALISLKWPKAGLCIFILLALFFTWFFQGASFDVLGLLILAPMLLLGIMFFFGRPEPKKWAVLLIVTLPLIIIFSVTPFKLYQISQRVNDGDFGPRLVEGNGVTLVWAPRGPGWPDSGANYYEALEACKYLSEDGTTLMDEEQNIWRLPTLDEAVGSMQLHNVNASGYWDNAAKKAVYAMTPDKETPLWDPHSKMIYYWVMDEESAERAYIVVYHGGVFSRYKDKSYGYLTFRAVKEPLD